MKVGAVSVTVPLLTVSVSVVVTLRTTWLGVVMVVVSVVAVDSTMVSVAVPMLRMDEQ